MPNQRKKGKKFLGTWFSPEELETLRLLAKREGKTMSQVLKDRIHEYLKKNQDAKNKTGRNLDK